MQARSFQKVSNKIFCYFVISFLIFQKYEYNIVICGLVFVEYADMMSA